MSKTTAPNKTPSPTSPKEQPEHNSSVEAQPTFAAASLNLAWQLLFIVIIPVLGGALLDNAIDTSPVFVLIGSVLALVGTVLVVRRSISELNWEMRKKDDNDK